MKKYIITTRTPEEERHLKAVLEGAGFEASVTVSAARKSTSAFASKSASPSVSKSASAKGRVTTHRTAVAAKRITDASAAKSTSAGKRIATTVAVAEVDEDAVLGPMVMEAVK